MNALKSYLDKNQLTYEAFAESIGVSVSTAWRYANGERHPRPAHMRKIAEVTKGWVTANDFMVMA